MALLVLNFDAYDSITKVSRPRVLVSGIGGEFEQRVPDGINTNLHNWKVGYSKRAGADVVSVSDFFSLHRGYKAFLWTPPGDVQRKFICEDYTRTLDNYNVVQSITATLEEIP